jgi:molecular chaperone HscA
LLAAGEIAEIEEKIAFLERAAATPHARAIKAASDALNRATEEFAARRMNASVRRALTGKSVESLDA